MKTRILVKEGAYKLAKAGVMDAKIDAEELFCFAADCDKVFLFLRKEEEVAKDVEEKFLELIERRAQRIPLQHIIGEQEFMGFKFKVTPDVLIPRQDTETLVTEAAQTIRQEFEKSMEQLKKASLFRKFKGLDGYEVLDLCCGSGAIAISLSKMLETVSVSASDISLPALKLAAENAVLNRVGVEFYQGDMFKAITEGRQVTAEGPRAKAKGTKVKQFDMIVSNPPYIKSNVIPMLQEEVKDHEPMEALDGGLDGLDYYRTIVKEAYQWLKPGGWLLMEIGHDQGEDLRKMIKDSCHYTPATVIKDLPGKDRVVKCRAL
ncbi:MAG: peptide chain release factor N(5)-glutamine methyltransferase [Bacillota bacterium]|nr:peptide chain release factor N(5)-glutamine methyltransferase [Bacillota bacterium]